MLDIRLIQMLLGRVVVLGGLMSTASARALSSSTARSSPSFVRVASYNVLSPSLARPSSHTMSDPADLDTPLRLARIKCKLEPEIAQKSVIALQEVSLSWAGPLHTWLLQHGYTLVTGLYGNPFNGYMGVGLAWPTDTYSALDIQIERVADTRSWAGRPRPSTLESLRRAGKFLLKVIGFGSSGRQKMFPASAPQDFNPWQAASKKFNQLAFVKLRSLKNAGQVVCIATYHMPCVFWAPDVMAIHTALACQAAQRLAGSDPCIFMGDFNFKPCDPPYTLVTSGSMPPGQELRQPVYEEEAAPGWDVCLEAPMRSAYREVLGTEPELTNWSHMGNNGEFVGCLDYIFFTHGLQPMTVVEIPPKEQLKGPFPSAEEPSDHLLVGATFSVT